MTQSTLELNGYVADFESLDRDLGSKGSWLAPLRQAAMSRFTELGFPTTRDELWKHTSVAPVAKVAFRRMPTARATSIPVAGIDDPASKLPGPRLVFVNGRFRGDLSSTPPSSTIHAGSLREAIVGNPEWLEPHLARHASFEDHAFVALNTAFLEDGAFVRVADRTVAEQPIQLCFFTTASDSALVSHPRVLVLVGDGAQATIVESYVGSDAARPTLTNAVTEIVAGDEAHVDHYKVQQESASAYHFATMHVRQGRSANVFAHSISLGGSLVRNDVLAVLAGEGGDCQLDGLYVLDERQHLDNHTLIDHAKPHCSSREMYKGVLTGQSRGVFYGKILVRKDAQKTDAKQTNKNLLLSNDALVNTMPQLEIYADDVKCTHGATIGQLDEDALFYLQARGIGRLEATRILTHAFVGEIIGRVKLEPLRTALRWLVSARMLAAMRENAR